jgi:hypothetical protein
MPNRTSGVISVIIRSILRLLAVALLGLALGAPLTGTAQAQPFPDRIGLPNGFQPEGITIGKRATAYLGSLADGDIIAVSLRTGERRLISEGLGPNFPSVGLKIDNRGRLFVAGGPSGTGRVIDVRTGKIIRNYTFTTETSFVNDVVLTRDYAWFTDSQQAQLYGVPLGRGGRRAVTLTSQPQFRRLETASICPTRDSRPRRLQTLRTGSPVSTAAD